GEQQIVHLPELALRGGGGGGVGGGAGGGVAGGREVLPDDAEGVAVLPAQIAERLLGAAAEPALENAELDDRPARAAGGRGRGTGRRGRRSACRDPTANGPGRRRRRRGAAGRPWPRSRRP